MSKLAASSLMAAAIALALTATPAVAEPRIGDDPVLDKKRVEEMIPNANVRSVTPVPIQGGLYEIIDENGNIFYMDGGGKIGFQSEIFDVSSKRNLTQESLARFRAVDFNALPLELAIKRVKGNGSRRLAVFSDPDCPFCAELETELRGVDDVTIYTFLYPIANLHPEATERARRIWCAADRDAAWLGWVIEQRDPPVSGNGCDSPLGQIADIAPGFWVEGTPSLVFGSGRVASGTLPQSQLEEFLSEALLARPPQAATAGAELR